MLKKTICLAIVVALLCAVPAFAADAEPKTSEAGILFIKEQEGFSATAYEDSVGWAIGYGTHCDVSLYPDGITEAEADRLLREHLVEIEGYIDNAMAGLGVKLTQNQYDAVASLTYNLGVGWLHSGYRLYNILAYGTHNYTDEYIVNAFARYSNTAGENTVEQLVERRFKEAMIFLYADYGFGGTPLYEFEYKQLDDDEYELYHRVWAEYSPARFSDVPYTQWYYQYISPLTYAGIIDGYPDGSFRPNSDVSAGEALKLILLAAGYPEQEHPEDTHWATYYLDYAVFKGFLEPGDVADLSGGIDRLTIAKLAAKALGLAESSGAPFTDTQDGYVSALYDAGIVEGSYSGDQLVYQPNEPISRAEISAVVWRIYNN